MKKKFLALLLAVLMVVSLLPTVALALAEGTITVTGQVTDKVTGLPIEGALVSYTQNFTPDDTTYSDSSGNFTFYDVPMGTFMIFDAHKDGYYNDPSARNFDEMDAPVATVTLSLQPDSPGPGQQEDEEEKISEIDGTVLEDGSYEAIVGAAVCFTCDGDDYTATADGDGEFYLEVPRNIEGTWTITAEGYETYTETVTYTSESYYPNFYMTAVSTGYAITNGTPESAKEANHGYIEIDKANAAEGEPVTITVKPNEGYQLKEGTLKVNDGAITLTGNTFKMPAANVTVTAEFEKASNGNFDLCNGEEILTMKPDTDPTWGTYKFVGWYTARTGGTKVESGFADGATYYAHWQVSSTDTTLVLTESIYVKADGVYISTGKLDNINLYGLTFAAAQGDDPVTLTMNNTVVEAGEGTDSGITFSSSHAFAALSTQIDLKIVLNGQNVLRVTRKVAQDTVIALCEVSQKSLTLSGTGSVTAEVNGSEGRCVFAVNAGNLTNSATLIANAKNTKAKSLDAVTVNKVLTNSGTITASAEGGVSNDGNAVGVMANESIKNTAGTITGYGGTGEYSDGVAIANGSLEITGGKVIGYGGTGVSEYYGVWAGGDITVSGTGVLEAHGGTKQGADPVALYLEATGKKITVKDNGQIIADAAVKNDGTYANACAVTGGNVKLAEGAVAVITKSGSANIVIKQHKHNPVKVNGQAATETAAGWSDYYECKDSTDACHKYFEDATAKVEIIDLDAWKAQGGKGYIAPLVHSITPVNGKNATDTEAGYNPYYECKNCGKYYEDATGLIEISNIDGWKAEGGAGYLAPLHGTDNDHDHICDYCDRQVSECVDADKDHKCDICGGQVSVCKDENNDHKCDICDGQVSECKDENNDHKCDICGGQVSEHKGVLVEGTAATLESAGFKSYYKCDCGKFFEDATCKVEITDLDAWKAQGGNGYIAKLEEEPTSPQTGDNSHMTLWVMLMALSSMGLCACLLLGKKRKNVQ